MKHTAILVFCAALVGCAPESQRSAPPTPDQCLRAELFKQCLQVVPAGPNTTKYNDWDEVVDNCESAAYYQSLRRPETIKPECRL